MLKGKRIVVVPLLVVAVIAIIVLGYFLWRKNFTSNLGSQIFKQAQKNPVADKIPETNPLGATKINPFKSIYPNPFDRISK